MLRQLDTAVQLGAEAQVRILSSRIDNKTGNGTCQPVFSVFRGSYVGTIRDEARKFV